MRVTLLGTAGGAPSPARETSCVLVRDDDRAVLLDAGTGTRRLLADRGLLDGIAHLDVVLTHFHFDHVAGLPYLQWLDLQSTIWAPGAWLYGEPSADILEPLRRPPISPNDVSGHAVEELRDGMQSIGGFAVRASAQPHHWAPSAGLRIGDGFAYITDTPYEESSVELARDVRHLLHEAWSPTSPDKDATAADAARVAHEANAGALTLVHLDPRVDDFSPILADAARIFEHVILGEDGLVLSV